MIIVIIYDRPYMEKNQSFQYILLWNNNAMRMNLLSSIDMSGNK